jgi:hypothetical protein
LKPRRLFVDFGAETLHLLDVVLHRPQFVAKPVNRRRLLDLRREDSFGDCGTDSRLNETSGRVFRDPLPLDRPSPP